MRLIGTLNSQDDALTFSDYLITLRMANHIEQGRDGTWQIWIERDDDLDQGTSQLREYTANPGDPKYLGVATRASRIRKEAYAEMEKRRKNFKDVRTSAAMTAARPAILSMICVAICILVAILTKLGDERANPTLQLLIFQPLSAILDPQNPDELRDGIGKYHLTTMFSSIASGQVWRLITPIFLHFGIVHILFNMMWVTSLGSAIERIKGPTIFLALVIVGGIAGNVGEALWNVYGIRSDAYSTFGGFSGVVYAFFGYAWMKGRLQPYEGLGVSQQTVGMMLAWLVLCILGALGNIANAAHVVGLIVGILFGAWPTIQRRIKTS